MLQAAFAERDTRLVTTELIQSNFLELGRIICLEINNHSDIWGIEYESNMPPIDTWFALDEHVKEQEAISYCWIPKAFERLTEQEVLVNYFWRDKSPNMFYNAVLLVMAKSA